MEITRFSLLKSSFAYGIGPWKKARASWMKKEPRLKKRLNLLGAMKIRGKNVKDRNRKRTPTIKKTPKAL